MMQLTRTVGAKDLAKARVMVLRPDFAAAYGRYDGSASTEPTVEMLMIEPPPASTIRVPINVERRNGPRRFTPSTEFHISSVMSSRDSYSGDFPALFTSTSTRPKRS